MHIPVCFSSRASTLGYMLSIPSSFPDSNRSAGVEEGEERAWKPTVSIFVLFSWSLMMMKRRKVMQIVLLVGEEAFILIPPDV